MKKKRQPTATCVGIFEILCKMKKTVRKKLLRILTPEVLWLKHKRSTSKIVEWEKKKRAKRRKNVLQCPMC